MYFGCVPSSLHINIALSFPSPSEPSEELQKETRPRPSPRTKRHRVSEPAGRLCSTPSAFPEALPGLSPLNIRLRNKRRRCKFLNRAICSARFTQAEISTKFRPYLRGAKILMVLGRGMSLAPRGPILRLDWHHAGHPWCLPALGDHSWAWGLSQVPPCLRIILGSWGPFKVLPCLGTTLGIVAIQGASMLGGHTGISGTICGHGDHPRCIPAWQSSWGLGDHPCFWGPSGELLCLGTMSGSQEPSQTLQNHPGLLGTILNPGEHSRCLPA